MIQSPLVPPMLDFFKRLTSNHKDNFFQTFEGAAIDLVPAKRYIVKEAVTGTLLFSVLRATPDHKTRRIDGWIEVNTQFVYQVSTSKVIKALGVDSYMSVNWLEKGKYLLIKPSHFKDFINKAIELSPSPPKVDVLTLYKALNQHMDQMEPIAQLQPKRTSPISIFDGIVPVQEEAEEETSESEEESSDNEEEQEVAKAGPSQVDKEKGKCVTEVGGYTFDESLSISYADMTSMVSLLIFIGRVAAKKGIDQIPVSKIDPNRLHIYTVGKNENGLF